MLSERSHFCGHRLSPKKLMKYAYADLTDPELRQPDPCRPGSCGYFTEPEKAALTQLFLEREICILQLLEEKGVPNVPRLAAVQRTGFAYLHDDRTLFPVSKTAFEEGFIPGREALFMADNQSVESVVAMGVSVADTLLKAYKAGVIAHNDIRPSNIIVGNDGEVYVVDWGSAEANGLSLNDEIGLRQLTAEYASLAKLVNNRVPGIYADTVSLSKTMLSWLSGAMVDITHQKMPANEYPWYVSEMILLWLEVANCTNMEQAVKLVSGMADAHLDLWSSLAESMFRETRRWDLPPALNRLLHRVVDADLNYSFEYQDGRACPDDMLVSLLEFKAELNSILCP